MPDLTTLVPFAVGRRLASRVTYLALGASAAVTDPG